jgi:hypothetical protein
MLERSKAQTWQAAPFTAPLVADRGRENPAGLDYLAKVG